MGWCEFTTEEYPELLEGNIGCCVSKSWGVYVKMLLDSFEWDRNQFREMSGLRVKQIKEKFGMLRVYCDVSTLSEIDKARVFAKIEMIDNICSSTCIECGSHEDVLNTTKQDGGWISPRCSLHR